MVNFAVPQVEDERTHTHNACAMQTCSKTRLDTPDKMASVIEEECVSQ